MITDRPETRLVLIAATLTAVELVLFIIVGRKTGIGFDRLFIDHFSDLIVSIATTWYVVFTYGLLSSAERSRRSRDEPYLAVSWQTSSNPGTEDAVGSNDVGKALASVLTDFGIEIFGQSQTSAGFVILYIRNQRSVRLGRISVEIEASVRPVPPVQIAGLVISPSIISWHSDSPRLENGQPLPVNVLDVRDIPSGFEVELRIKSLQYTPADSNQIIRDYGGDAIFRVRGMASPQPASPKTHTLEEDLK